MHKIRNTDSAGSKTKSMNSTCIGVTAVIILSLLSSLSIFGPLNTAAGSLSSPQIEGQQLEEEEQLQQTPESSLGSSGSSMAGGANTNITTTTAGNSSTENNTLLYENAEHGIQIRYPQDWIYLEMDTELPLEFQVVFVSPQEAFEAGRAQEAGGLPATPSGVSVMIAQLPFGNVNVGLLEDIITTGLAADGSEIVSTNSEATLTGMPAIEIVAAQPQNGTRQLQVWTVHEGKGYGIGYVSHESRFDQSLSIAQDMIRSFVIANGTGTGAATTRTDNNNSANNTVASSSNIFDSATQATDLEAARQHYLEIWNQTQFQIAFNTFIEPGSATGYGIFDELNNNSTFEPGETIELYAEPVGFGQQKILDNNANILYLMNLTADILVSDTNGNELASIEDAPLIDIMSHRQNTEMQLILTVTQNDAFPVGDYIITYIVNDQVKRESSQIDKRITIAADDDSGATSSFDNSVSTTTTEGENQNQQPQVEWLSYENATYGVRMLYPSSWMQEDGTTTEDERFTFVSNFVTPEEENGSYAYVSISIDNMPESTDLEVYLSDTVNSYRQNPSFENFQLLSSASDRFTLSGMPAYAFEATYRDPEFGPQHMLEVGVIVDNRVYYIQYVADTPIYQTHFSLAEMMIESFEIIQ